MLLIYPKLILVLILFCGARAQEDENRGYFDIYEDFSMNPSYVALEKTVDPKDYIIGPGDVFGININTLEKMFFSASVGPVGDILIPGIGSVEISGFSLEQSINLIKMRIKKTFKNAEIDISLIGLKSFKVHVHGAVNKPGFAVVKALSRLDAVLSLVGGLHRDAREDSIVVLSKDSVINIINLKNYLTTGDLKDNPILNEGDRINIFYRKDFDSTIGLTHTRNKTAILVSGFVNTPGPRTYFPGYSIDYYIGLAGGITELASSNKIILIRDNIRIRPNRYDIVLPGDHIFIPEGSFSVLFGKSSFLQNITALFSIISTYTIISDRLNN